MSNAPEDKRPASDIADQTAGIPDSTVDTTATAGADAAASDDSDSDADPDLGARQPEQQTSLVEAAEPEPLVEPAAPEASTKLAFLEPSADASESAPEADAAEGLAVPATVDTARSTDTNAAPAEPVADPIVERAPQSAPTDPAPPAHDAAPPAPDPATPVVAPAAPQSPPAPAVAPAPASPAAPQTVFVTAPTPPKKRSNRGVGTLLAVLGAIAFGLLHSLITAIAYLSAGRAFDVTRFLLSSGFLVPTIVFFVVFVIAVLLINRAGWWAWVLGSLVVAAATYFASIGIIMLLENAVSLTPAQGAELFEVLAVSAPMVIAVIVAREVAVWFGLAIAARGRKVKARNAEAKAGYERELAESRQRYGTVAA